MVNKWDVIPGLTAQVKVALQAIEEALGRGEVAAVHMEEEQMNEEGFAVQDEYQLPSLTDVKEDRVLLPTAQNVLVRIDRASTRLSRPAEKGNASSGTVRSLNLQVRFPEGIEVPSENGEAEVKYVNKVDFVEVEYQVVNPEARQEDRYTGKNQAFLVPLKQLLLALDYDLEKPPKIDDAFLAELVGKTFRLNIGKRPINVFDDATGKWEATGEYRNTYRNFKAS